MNAYKHGIFKQILPQYGIVTTSDGEEFFISRFDGGGAFSGDSVTIQVTKVAQGGKKSEAHIVKIIKRTNEPLVCICKKKYKTGEVIALVYRSTATAAIKITGKREKLRNGDIVSLRITSGVENPLGIIEKYIGNERESDIEERIILIQNNISKKFPEEVEKAAEKLQSPGHSGKRLDLRKLFTVTIDGEDAKDLDDAISIKKLQNGNFELWVHIADVAEYIPEKSSIDIEALKRGTSIYLPDSVIPMLPERLSNDLCSLHPGTPKLTLSIRMELNSLGRVISRSLHETIIESDFRLTYTFVAQVLEKKIEKTKVSPELKNLIYLSRELKLILDKRRKQEGKIDFDLPEIKVILDKNGKAMDIKKRERNEAHKIIEEFMVLANEEVSKFFATKKIPFLYRTHDIPGDLALQKLSQVAANYGHSFNPEKPRPRDIQLFLESIKNRPYEYHIARLTLQSMARAQYNDLLLGHYGLALYYYSHFTSPIRRYPDLQIHRIIKEFLHEDLDKERLKHYSNVLKKVAQSCSNNERQAEGIERSIKELKIIEYMEQFIGKTYPGVVSFINEYGCNVELPNGVEGFIHSSNYPMAYVYDETRQILKAKRREDDIFIGKPIIIIVTEANKKSRRLSFAFGKR